MDRLGTRIKVAREALGLSQEELAKRVGVRQQTIQELEAGRSRTTRHIHKLAEALGQTPQWLESGTGQFVHSPAETGKSNVRNMTEASVPALGSLPQDVPVLGVAVGGSNGDFMFSGQIIEYVRRTPGIMTKRDVYVLYIQGDSMSPWAEPGDMIPVDPNQPTRPGDYVVIELKPEMPGEPGPAFVKKLVAVTPNKIRVSQFNPAKTFEFQKDKVLRLHHVLTRREMMGA